MSEPTDATTAASSSDDDLSPRITVGIIVGIAGIATILIIFVLYAMMICKYCFYKRTKKHLRTAGGGGGVTLYGGGSGYYYGSSTGTGTFTKQFSREDSYNMSPRGLSASGSDTFHA